MTKIPSFKQRPLGLANRSRATIKSQPLLERPKIQEEQTSNNSENLNEEDSENYLPQMPMNNQIGNEFLPNTPVVDR